MNNHYVVAAIFDGRVIGQAALVCSATEAEKWHADWQTATPDSACGALTECFASLADARARIEELESA